MEISKALSVLSVLGVLMVCWVSGTAHAGISAYDSLSGSAVTLEGDSVDADSPQEDPHAKMKQRQKERERRRLKRQGKEIPPALQEQEETGGGVRQEYVPHSEIRPMGRSDFEQETDEGKVVGFGNPLMGGKAKENPVVFQNRPIDEGFRSYGLGRAIVFVNVKNMTPKAITGLNKIAFTQGLKLDIFTSRMSLSEVYRTMPKMLLELPPGIDFEEDPNEEMAQAFNVRQPMTIVYLEPNGQKDYFSLYDPEKFLKRLELKRRQLGGL